MPQSKFPTIDQHLCFALYATSLQMTQRYKPMLDALNLTYPQYLILLVLWEKEGLGIKDLAERLQQDPGSITPLVKRLESNGYLSRRRDENDERSLIIMLTEAGNALRAKASEINSAIQQMCDLSDPAMTKLIGELAKLRKKRMP
ncbi:MarR family winged helix-turn-helix transcriptional regulator [Chitinimonas sp. BJB300]|uniref:MarR family winged helix-turn-helix transcriptional regulator n=1 Tax=Chitinimonas sp. BJB300 TaxID=1559339 RepID=UPI000C1090CA|nr:MarR family transcriptional regulator [Chitinimonas sp. BJB300]PHV09920.1 MarR family transcriptional regulator [Chitinimonas sp. BJB300]TSJ87351.1 MarR family transcriptional regulator [Chitinimonas sp. BJB300]